jgi:glucuronokinase
MLIQTRAYARAGLIGNPSDGYFGKTIAFTFKNFFAEVILYQSPELEILPNSMDRSVFASVHRLVDDVNNFGYYGGVRLLKATVKKFADYCSQNSIQLDDRNFTIRYSSNIPHRVGLAGSSAIITACMRALMSFYQVSIPKPALAALILTVENEELGISAGLQDRVVQVYGGVVYMDFDKQLMQRQGHGRYENLDPALLPPLYIAYLNDVSEGSEVFHNSVRERFEMGDKQIVEAMLFWADLAAQARGALFSGDSAKLHALMNSNFDKRRELYQLGEKNIQMVERARSVGASAKFSGSGGAIVGICAEPGQFERLKQVLEPLNVSVIRPEIGEANED